MAWRPGCQPSESVDVESRGVKMERFEGVSLDQVLSVGMRCPGVLSKQTLPLPTASDLV